MPFDHQSQHRERACIGVVPFITHPRVREVRQQTLGDALRVEGAIHRGPLVKGNSKLQRLDWPLGKEEDGAKGKEEARGKYERAIRSEQQEEGDKDIEQKTEQHRLPPFDMLRAHFVQLRERAPKRQKATTKGNNDREQRRPVYNMWVWAVYPDFPAGRGPQEENGYPGFLRVRLKSPSWSVTGTKRTCPYRDSGKRHKEQKLCFCFRDTREVGLWKGSRDVDSLLRVQGRVESRHCICLSILRCATGYMVVLPSLPLVFLCTDRDRNETNKTCRGPAPTCTFPLAIGKMMRRGAILLVLAGKCKACDIMNAIIGRTEVRIMNEKVSSSCLRAATRRKGWVAMESTSFQFRKQSHSCNHPVTRLCSSIQSMGINQARQSVPSIIHGQLDSLYKVVDEGNICMAMTRLLMMQWLHSWSLISFQACFKEIGTAFELTKKTIPIDKLRHGYELNWLGSLFAGWLIVNGQRTQADAVMQNVEKWHYEHGLGYHDNVASRHLRKEALVKRKLIDEGPALKEVPGLIGSDSDHPDALAHSMRTDIHELDINKISNELQQT
ncbi:hypothetical protein BX600DRAFT_442636 [Xylariales sp. PMI_506]|nr:hypothetical protein BX600DRAFT_442636 [Xylariales sp. PMI_506]